MREAAASQSQGAIISVQRTRSHASREAKLAATMATVCPEIPRAKLHRNANVIMAIVARVVTDHQPPGRLIRMLTSFT